MLDSTSSKLANNVRALREQHGLTQQRLAAVSGVPRPTIANLESGQANPTLSVLVKIAAALQVSLEELIAEPREQARLYRESELPADQRGRARVRQLLPDATPTLGFARLDLPASVRLASGPHAHGTREYLLCESGELQVAVGAASFELGAGDLLCFRGDQRHAYHNRGRGRATAYSVVVLAPLGSAPPRSGRV